MYEKQKLNVYANVSILRWVSGVLVQRLMLLS